MIGARMHNGTQAIPCREKPCLADTDLTLRYHTCRMYTAACEVTMLSLLTATAGERLRSFPRST